MFLNKGVTIQQDELDRALHYIRRSQEKGTFDNTSYSKSSLIVIAGPTCCGKTDLAILLAKTLGGEVVSSDSMQVYRGMDIGTAKASNEQRSQVVHHLLDIRDVTDPLTVVDFFDESYKACQSISARGQIPIVVGGAGFYLDVFLYGIPEGPPSDPVVRKELDSEAIQLGVDEMYRRLSSLDPEYAKTITKHDKQKIIRALEIILLSGKKVSDFSWKSRSLLSEYNYHCWFIHRPREVLYEKVEERCDQIIADGLLDEIIALEEQGLRSNSSASHAIGYRQGLRYLASDRTDDDYDTFVKDFKTASRRYVKRQFAWFKHKKIFQRLDVDRHDHEIASDIIIQEFISW